MAWISGMSWVTPLRLPPVRETASGMSALQTRTHACSLNYGDNVAVQEAVQPRRRTAVMPGKSSLTDP
jgi:hypothetical protein